MCDPDLQENLRTIFYAEVYSLRNDSWKRLTIDDDLIPELDCDVRYVPPQQRGNHHSQNQQSRCCWFYAYSGLCYTVSFDMSEEVFESTFIALPPPLCGKAMYTHGCFMLKDSLLAIFHDGANEDYSIWCLLKQEVADSWTKVCTFPSPAWSMEFLQVWKEDMCICSRESREYFIELEPQEIEETSGMYIFSPHRLENIVTESTFKSKLIRSKFIFSLRLRSLFLISE